MSEAIIRSSSDNYQWTQYQNLDESPVPQAGGPSDSISINSSFNTLAPESSFAVGNDLRPRGSAGKLARRRSRASRRTPTTLLNASIKNFRTLVQQYTGCQTSASSMNNNNNNIHRGPINMSFGSPSSGDKNIDDFAARNSFGGPLPQYFQDQNKQQLYQHQDDQYLQIYQEGPQGLFQQLEDENNGDFSAFSSSDIQNMMAVNNFGWQ